MNPKRCRICRLEKHPSAFPLATRWALTRRDTRCLACAKAAHAAHRARLLARRQIGHRICTACRETKPLTNFTRWGSECRQCTRDRDRITAKQLATRASRSAAKLALRVEAIETRTLDSCRIGMTPHRAWREANEWAGREPGPIPLPLLASLAAAHGAYMRGNRMRSARVDVQGVAA